MTLTWSSVVDGGPDRSSRGRWLIVPDVCKECSSKRIHCSKVHGSYHPRPRTIGRANSTKIPSPRIDPGERPTDPGWRGKEGTASGIKNKEGAQSLGKKKTLTFFPWRHTTAARRKSRMMTEVEIRRPKAGCATRPIAQTGPAIGMRAGTWLVAKTRKSTAGWCFFAPRSNRESANNETTTTTRHPEPELRDPRPDPSDDRPRELASSLFERH